MLPEGQWASAGGEQGQGQPRSASLNTGREVSPELQRPRPGSRGVGNRDGALGEPGRSRAGAKSTDIREFPAALCQFSPAVSVALRLSEPRQPLAAVPSSAGGPTRALLRTEHRHRDGGGVSGCRSPALACTQAPRPAEGREGARLPPSTPHPGRHPASTGHFWGAALTLGGLALNISPPWSAGAARGSMGQTPDEPVGVAEPSRQPWSLAGETAEVCRVPRVHQRGLLRLPGGLHSTTRGALAPPLYTGSGR